MTPGDLSALVTHIGFPYCASDSPCWAGVRWATVASHRHEKKTKIKNATKWRRSHCTWPWARGNEFRMSTISNSRHGSGQHVFLKHILKACSELTKLDSFTAPAGLRVLGLRNATSSDFDRKSFNGRINSFMRSRCKRQTFLP